MTEFEEAKLRRPSRLRIVDHVYQSLEEAILSGQVRPGARLRETAIAEQLHVSRTVVREAFLMLELQGLVASEPRRGTFVTRLSRSDALDLGYTRSLLEAFAVTVGYHRIDHELISDLEQLLDQMRSCTLPEEFPRLVSIDVQFHGKLVKTAEMPRLFQLWSSLNGRLGALYIRGVEEMNLETDDLVNLHRRLLNAIQSGPEAARTAIIEHYVRDDGMHTAAGVAAQETLRAFSPRWSNDVPNTVNDSVEDVYQFDDRRDIE